MSKIKDKVKFVFFLLYLIAIFWVQRFTFLVMLFLWNFVPMKIFKMGIGKFVNHLKIVLPFVIFTASLNGIIGEVKMGVLMAGRLLVAYQITYLFSKSMSSVELAGVIQDFAYPFRIFKIDHQKIGLMVSISFCVLPILKTEIEQKKYALKAKGLKLDLKYWFVMIKPLIISILRRTKEMEKVLIAKGYQE